MIWWIQIWPYMFENGIVSLGIGQSILYIEENSEKLWFWHVSCVDWLADPIEIGLVGSVTSAYCLMDKTCWSPIWPTWMKSWGNTCVNRSLLWKLKTNEMIKIARNRARSLFELAVRMIWLHLNPSEWDGCRSSELLMRNEIWSWCAKHKNLVDMGEETDREVRFLQKFDVDAGWIRCRFRWLV